MALLIVLVTVFVYIAYYGFKVFLDSAPDSKLIGGGMLLFCIFIVLLIICSSCGN